MRFMRSMEMASLSVRWRTSSRMDQFPGPGLEVRSSLLNPATDWRRRVLHATYSSIHCLFIATSSMRLSPAGAGVGGRLPIQKSTRMIGRGDLALAAPCVDFDAVDR